ncbi:MAG TPA: WHG domain-containing protein [Acidimicrobiales bacterium]
MTPARTPRSARAREVVVAARALVEAEGREALTMRRLGEALGIRAPSLYKHVADKAAVETALVEEVLAEVGAVLHRAAERGMSVAAVLAAYRRYGLAHSHLYRLATGGPIDRAALPPGLEEWTGEPFLVVAGDEHRARALWSLAHGMVVLEIDGRYPAGARLDEAWRAGAAAFAR